MICLTRAPTKFDRYASAIALAVVVRAGCDGGFGLAMAFEGYCWWERHRWRDGWRAGWRGVWSARHSDFAQPPALLSARSRQAGMGEGG